MKDLYGLGARRIGVLSTLPVGCLPGGRTVATGLLEGGCEEITNQEAQVFNTKLSSMVDSLESSLPDAELVFIDVYNPLLDIVQDPQNYGNFYLFLYENYVKSFTKALFAIFQGLLVLLEKIKKENRIR